MDDQFHDLLVGLDARPWWTPLEPLGADYRPDADGTIFVPADRVAVFTDLGCLPLYEAVPGDIDAQVAADLAVPPAV